MIRRLSQHELTIHAARPISLMRVHTADAATAAAPEGELASTLEQLLADERALAPERVRGLLLRELARFRGDRELRLRVHPHDHGCLPDAAELAATFELVDLPTIVADEALEPGGFTITSARGELDARVETQVERALAQLSRGRS
jgi:flagellar biosynthesis/type III secretory pathway protein FliH